MMNLQLIAGEFEFQEALDLITELVHLKIKYHERKIAKDTNEEDIKVRELKIRQLQKELYEFRNQLSVANKKMKIEAQVKME